MSHIPYTYLIGWSNQNKWYYGCEYGQKTKMANPNNLWTTYFTSSDEVSKFREEHGEPDVIQIRKTFSSEEKTRRWEHKVLRRLNVKTNSKWLNKHEASHKVGHFTPHSQQTKDKISAAKKGKTAWNKGLKWSEDTIKKMSKPRKYMPPKTAEHKQKLSQSNKGKPGTCIAHTEETKRKISNARKLYWERIKSNVTASE